MDRPAGPFCAARDLDGVGAGVRGQPLGHRLAGAEPGYRKRNRPDAVYRRHRPPPIAAHEDRAGNLAFDLDPADPGGSAGRALAKAARGVFRAAGEGRIEDGLKPGEAARSVVRTARVMGLGGGC